MESAMPLRQAFQEVADALSISGRDVCVAVWPTTATGCFVDEFQVLTEREWQRLLRVGLRLTPAADVKELYCFRNVLAYNGLTVRVLRLVQESQTRVDGGREVWKVQTAQVMDRRRTGVEELVETTMDQRENSSYISTAGDTPPRAGNVAMHEAISPEEKQTNRRRSDAAGGRGIDSKCTTDEVRPPTKTCRLNGKRKERDAAIAPIRLHTGADSTIALVGSSQQPKRPKIIRRIHSSSDAEAVHTESIGVIEDSNSSSLSSGDLDNEGNTVYATSNGVYNDEETHGQDSVLSPSPTRRTVACSVRIDHSERGTLFPALQKVVAAGMCIGDEADFEKDQTKCISSTRARAVTQSTSTTNPFNPLWSILESTTTRVYKVLNNICGLSPLLEATTAQDSMDYDLLWIEEDDQQHWTMFGEPSTSGRIGLKTRLQQREQIRTTRSKWKFRKTNYR